VIVGRLIPAGTGLSHYTRAEVLSAEAAAAKPAAEPTLGEPSAEGEAPVAAAG
jgi:hypothetical protein